MAEPRGASERVVVVGGGLAGARTCASLRAAGHAAEIVLLGSEPYLPYDRPPLSKVGLTGDVDTTLEHDYAALGVSLSLGVRAIGVDLAGKVLRTEGGDLEYGFLVVATGAEPVALPGAGPAAYLRTREDADRLRRTLTTGARVVVVGAGWIGAEVATAALEHGCDVTVLEGASTPLGAQLGTEVGSRLASWWHQVSLRTDVRVERLVDDGVCLVGGEVLEADVVLVGVGVRPAVGWLRDSGLLLDGGVAVDSDRRSSDPSVFAVGDAAARWSPRYGARVVSGHWDEAVLGPAAAAAAIVGAPRGVDDVPYFWSDQFGRKLQYVGQHSTQDAVVMRELDETRWGAAWVSPDGRLTAHLSVGTPRAMVQARAAIEEQRIVSRSALVDLNARP